MTERSVINCFKKGNGMSPRSADQFREMRAQSKAKITETAIRLFAKNGYSETTIEAIASQCRVAKGLVYNYFKNKEDLLLYSFMSAFEEIEASFPSSQPSADPVAMMQLFINGMFDHFKKHMDFWRLQMAIMMQPSVPKRLQATIMKKLREYIALFAGIFEQNGVEHALAEAWLFAASMDGVMLYCLFNVKECPLDDIRTVLLNTYVSLIRPAQQKGGRR